MIASFLLRIAALLQATPTPGVVGIGTNDSTANSPLVVFIFAIVFMVVLIGAGVAVFRWRMRHIDLW